MASSPVSPRLAHIQLHPIKALDPVPVKEARIGPGGGLELDRAWALYSADGQWVNGKRTPAVHLIRAVYAPDVSAVTLSVPGDRRGIPTSTFAFPADTAGAAEWFSAYFEEQITIRYSLEGFPDDSIASGPTIVSAASLDAVSTWFQKRFSELRRAHLPSWSPSQRFDHFYRLATNTRVPPSESGKTLRVGDPVLLQ